MSLEKVEHGQRADHALYRGVTERLWDRRYALIAGNLRRYLDGGRLRGLVDKSKGY